MKIKIILLSILSFLFFSCINLVDMNGVQCVVDKSQYKVDENIKVSLNGELSSSDKVKSLRVGIALFKYENGIQDLENLPEIEIMKFDEKYDVDDQSNLGCFSSFWNSLDLITVIDEDFEFKVKESGTYLISVVIHAGGEDIECTGVAAFQFPITISE